MKLSLKLRDPTKLSHKINQRTQQRSNQVHQGPQAVVPLVMSTFSLGPGWSTSVFDFAYAAVKLYNKAITPLELKFDREADNLAVFLASVKDQCNCFNWSHLVTIPLADSTTRNLLTHYGQFTLSNCIDHGNTYITTQTRNAQNNDMLYYFLVDSLESKFRAKVLLYSESYSAHNVVVASALLKQIIIVTRIDTLAAATHVREFIIESKKQLLKLKGNVTEFNSWVRKQVNKLHARDQEAMDLTHYLRRRSIFGVLITTLEQVCGPFTTPTNAKVIKKDNDRPRANVATFDTVDSDSE